MKPIEIWQRFTLWQKILVFSLIFLLVYLGKILLHPEMRQVLLHPLVLPVYIITMTLCSGYYIIARQAGRSVKRSDFVVGILEGLLLSPFLGVLMVSGWSFIGFIEPFQWLHWKFFTTPPKPAAYWLQHNNFASSMDSFYGLAVAILFPILILVLLYLMHKWIRKRSGKANQALEIAILLSWALSAFYVYKSIFFSTPGI